MSPSMRSIIGSVLIIISTMCLAFILSHFSSVFGWMDFTSNKRYTLTEGTKSILAKVNRPLKAKLFYSKQAVDKVGTDQLKQYNGAYVYARDLLEAYERASNGKLSLEEYDPVNYSKAAEEATALGIQVQRLPADEVFAFGLAVTSDTGAKEVIPFINAMEEGLFEYKITKLIERASRPAKNKLGVLSSINVLGDNASPEMARLMQMQGRQPAPRWNFIEWLAADYEVEGIEATADSIPDDINFLLVVQPKKLGDPTLYAIDQFVMRGGKLAVFEDPFCVSDQPTATGREAQYAEYTHDRSSDLNRLTNAWGVKLDTGRIMGDRALAPADQGMQLFQFSAFNHNNDSFNKDEVITETLGAGAQVIAMYPGSVSKVDGVEGVDVAPLISTTETAGSRKFGNMDYMRTRQNPGPLWEGANPDGTSDGEKEGLVLANAPLWLGVRVTGKFKSAFPGGKPAGNTDAKPADEKDKKDDKPAEHLKEAKETSSIVVFADVDMISNNLISSPNNWMMANPYANNTVVQNVVDYLGGSSDLISIRSRGIGRRGFDYIDEIRKKAAAKTADKMKSIQDEIDKFQKDLRDLQAKATNKNIGVARAEALKNEREARIQIAKRKRELNEVRRESSVEEQAVKDQAWWMNVFGLPALVFIIGLILFLLRASARSQRMREDMA